MYKRRTIVLVPFPFTDLTSMKVRPALIVSNDKLKTDDVSVIFISSLVPRFISTTDYILRRDNQDFAATGLRASSIFKAHKIATLDKKIILGELGTLSERVQIQIDKRLRLVFGL